MKCQECKKPLTRLQARLGGRFCSRDCFGHFYSRKRQAINSAPDYAAAFWGFVAKRSAEQCWLWLGAVHGDDFPYGKFRRAGAKRRYAHQIAYELIKGSIPQGAVVRHSCDNPRCCNPDHLLIGTQRDNNRDKHERWRHEHGQEHHNARLTEQQVREIRSLRSQGWSAPKLAARFGIKSTATIYSITKRRTWPHVS